MTASILRSDVSSRHVRSSRRLFRKLTRLGRSAARTFASTASTNAASASTASESPASKSNECTLPCSSAVGLLALYGLPFPIMINP